MKWRPDASVASALWLAAANILITVAVLLFATGFFPYKPVLSGLAQYDDSNEHGEPPKAPFDRLVFMVVDALRRYLLVLEMPRKGGPTLIMPHI